jgi:photosystem II stability/assembly factor-like uncharacterized protein
MNRHPGSHPACVTLPAIVTCVTFLAFPALASAQWARVLDVQPTDMFTVWANCDTIVAGADSVVYISTNAGTTWKRSAPVAAGLFQVDAVLVRNGRLYAGTQQNHGVLVSDDLGDTWSDYNQGLSGLGSLDVIELISRGDSLYLATVGGGAWVRDVHSGPWIHFGNQIEAFQASNMTTIAAGGSRLFAAGGFNGTVFYRDPGQPDWTVSLLFNDRFAPGLAGLSAFWTGHRWLVGSNIGIFHSPTGHEPWTLVDFGIRPILFVGFAASGPDLFASLGAGGGTLIAMSRDDGVTWQGVDSLFSAFVYRLARVGTTLYAGRVDGLWRRSIAGIADVPDSPTPRLAFAIAGLNPVRDQVRFVFELPTAGPIAIDVFDVRGRKVGEVTREMRPAGRGEIGWDVSRLASGIYYARFTAAGHHATARVVHIH